MRECHGLSHVFSARKVQLATGDGPGKPDGGDFVTRQTSNLHQTNAVKSLLRVGYELLFKLQRKDLDTARSATVLVVPR